MAKDKPFDFNQMLEDLRTPSGPYVVIKADIARQLSDYIADLERLGIWDNLKDITDNLVDLLDLSDRVREARKKLSKE